MSHLLAFLSPDRYPFVAVSALLLNMAANLSMDVYAVLHDILSQPLVTGCIEDFGFLSVADALSKLVHEVLSSERNTIPKLFTISLPNGIVLKKSITIPSSSVTIQGAQLDSLRRSWNAKEFLSTFRTILSYNRKNSRKRSTESPLAYRADRTELESGIKKKKRTQGESGTYKLKSTVARQLNRTDLIRKPNMNRTNISGYDEPIVIADSPEKPRLGGYTVTSDVDMRDYDGDNTVQFNGMGKLL